jgi:hypothetical protein
MWKVPLKTVAAKRIRNPLERETVGGDVQSAGIQTRPTALVEYHQAPIEAKGLYSKERNKT